MRFALLFMGLASAPEATDAQTAEYNQQWGRWMGDLVRRQALVSAAQFDGSGTVVTARETSELQLQRVDLGGFVVVEADDSQAAIAIAREAPHMELGGTTIVRGVVARD